MSEKEVAEYAAVPDPTNETVMPVMGLSLARERRNAIVEFTKSIMTEGKDYGVIPGTTKPTLLKPGAEKLTTFFGLSTKFIPVDSELDWTGNDHGGEPFFYFQYRCVLSRGEYPVGEGVGSCNSWEKKYRYRSANRVCPVCGEEAIIKGKEEYGGGWLCFRKKGGCGQKWPDGAEEIEGQSIGIVLNDNPADLVNTIDKMAQKRALISATLIAVNASEFFTQDLEDIVTIVSTSPEDEDTETTEKPKGNKSKSEKKSNGKSYPEYMIKALVEEGLVDHAKHAVNILNLFPKLARNTSTERVILLAQIYRKRVDDNGLPRQEAAKVAWDEWNSS